MRFVHMFGVLCVIAEGISLSNLLECKGEQ